MSKVDTPIKYFHNNLNNPSRESFCKINPGKIARKKTTTQPTSPPGSLLVPPRRHRSEKEHIRKGSLRHVRLCRVLLRPVRPAHHHHAGKAILQQHYRNILAVSKSGIINAPITSTFLPFSAFESCKNVCESWNFLSWRYSSSLSPPVGSCACGGTSERATTTTSAKPTRAGSRTTTSLRTPGSPSSTNTSRWVSAVLSVISAYLLSNLFI